MLFMMFIHFAKRVSTSCGTATICAAVVEYGYAVRLGSAGLYTQRFGQGRLGLNQAYISGATSGRMN